MTGSAPGRFIAFEGGEGVGKSTQAKRLANALQERGIQAMLTREPGGTRGAEAIRALLLDPALPQWSAAAEALLFAAARADHVASLIRPALAAGQWVICDRFVDSSRAYQGAASGVGDEAVRSLHLVGSGGLLPDLTILLELPEDDAAARLAERDQGGSDKIGGRGADYHARVGAAFAGIADAEPGRFCRVDARGAADAVHARVLAAVEPLVRTAAR